MFTLENVREGLEALGPYILAGTDGGREKLRELVDPRLHDIVDQLTPADLVNAVSVVQPGYSAGMPVDIQVVLIPVRDSGDQLIGTLLLSKPAASMAVLATMAVGGDLRHFERMQQVAKPGRRPAAILFADMESSSPLARRLSTASYFSLGRRMARAADQCVIDAGGSSAVTSGMEWLRSSSPRAQARNRPHGTAQSRLSPSKNRKRSVGWGT
ncbi:MAG: hypothetical protein ACLQMH_12925 [Solirubrobacteraceae bacterium]